MSASTFRCYLRQASWFVGICSLSFGLHGCVSCCKLVAALQRTGTQIQVHIDGRRQAGVLGAQWACSTAVAVYKGHRRRKLSHRQAGKRSQHVPTMYIWHQLQLCCSTVSSCRLASHRPVTLCSRIRRVMMPSHHAGSYSGCGAKASSGGVLADDGMLMCRAPSPPGGISPKCRCWGRVCR